MSPAVPQPTPDRLRGDCLGLELHVVQLSMQIQHEDATLSNSSVGAASYMTNQSPVEAAILACARQFIDLQAVRNSVISPLQLFSLV